MKKGDNKETINVNFDLVTLNLMCSYALSDNSELKRSQFINLRELMNQLNIDLYINDTERMKRVQFIKKAIEARLDKNLTKVPLILNYINGSIIDEEFIDPANFEPLTAEEINWINETVGECVKFSYIYNDMDDMVDICSRFKAADYKSRGVIVKEFENLISGIQNKFRKVNSQASDDKHFSLLEGDLENRLAEFHEESNLPSKILYTGMQGVNEMLGGGFQSQRTYLFIGNTGAGKSLTLLDMIYQMKEYNRNYQPKDKTKIPTIVYLTQENSELESVERLLQMALRKGFKDYRTSGDLIGTLKQEGSLCITNESNINIYIKYVPNRSIDTSYLYTLCDNLEDDGMEVICLVQDHIKRIRSTSKQQDLRLELGDVVNELKTFAILKDIPVITNTHVNRDGAKAIEDARQNNKLDITKRLGKSNVGESLLMIDNVDGAFIIGPEYDSDGNKYMAFNRIKERYKCSNMTYLCQPYSKSNPIKLLEDLNLENPIYKETLRIQNEGTLKLHEVRGIYNKIEQLDENAEIEEFVVDNSKPSTTINDILYSKNNSSYCNFSMEMMNRTRYSSEDYKTEEEKEQEKIRKQIQELSNRKEVIQVLTFV